MGRERASEPTFPSLKWFEALREAAAADAELAVIGRWCTLDITIVADAHAVLLRLREGRISEIVPDPDIGVSWNVTLRGTLDNWCRFLQPSPPPFYNHLLAMSSCVPTFTIEGDRRTFVRHLRALGRLFELAQQVGNEHA